MSVNVVVFVYTGAGGERIPEDVVRVLVDPSVTSIPASSFSGRKKLAEVDLCEGVVEIGAYSFDRCDHSITKINIPNSLRRILDSAFCGSLQTPIRLHDGIESIGEGAFAACIFTNLRIPPLITMIPDTMLYECITLFSLEISDNIREIRSYAFEKCYHLRNVAFPSNAVISDDIFFDEAMDTNMHPLTDLRQLFGCFNARIISELQHRFDGLPIHRIVYYLSYNQGVLQNLIAAINLRSSQRRTLRSQLDTTGNQQDCLGMTPLHILACLSTHDLELYRVIIENYPTNLVTEDRWGTLPILYAFWGAAPAEIIQFLLKSYQSFFPDYVFNWTNMVWTMGRCDTPKERIENLLSVKQMYYPEQPIDWDHLLDEFASPPSHSSFIYTERMQFLVMCGMSERVEALAFKVWRDHITNMIHTADFKCCHNVNYNNFVYLHRIREKVAHFEDELPKLKEATSVLELALWKWRMNENIPQNDAICYQPKIKRDESSIRRQCRITCGADVIIRHLLPFLIC
jgi:hypothetical protein